MHARNDTLCLVPVGGHTTWVRQVHNMDALCASSFLACCASMLKHLDVSADVWQAACGRYAPQQLDAVIMSRPDSGLAPQQNKFRSKAGYRCAI